VPVGTCLSGGLDSSSIVCVMDRLLAQHVPDSVSLGDRLKTFSAVFPGDPIDERRYVEAVLAVTSADPTWVQPTSEQWLAELETWVWHAEEPMITTAPYAMWSVMRAASEKVTVLLDGQAGDELLGGYVPYQYVYLRQLLRERRYREFALESAKARDTVGRLARRRLWEGRHQVDVGALLRPAWTSGKRGPTIPASQDDLKKRLLQDLTTFSLPSLLRYEDRNSMAHSMESRLPFLDQELVEWILRLPASAIVSGGWSRRILREAMRGVLPETIRERRRKIGFTTPGVPLVPPAALLDPVADALTVLPVAAVLGRAMRSPTPSGSPAPGAARSRSSSGAPSTSSSGCACTSRAGPTAPRPAPPRTARSPSPLRATGRRGGGRGAEELVAAARPNPGRHLIIRRRGETWARIPLRAELVRNPRRPGRRGGGGPGGRGHRHRPGARRRGRDEREGGRDHPGAVLPHGRDPVTPLARLLSRFVSRVPIGIGLGRPQTMQLALEEAGASRILLAAACAAVTRPLRGPGRLLPGGRIPGVGHRRPDRVHPPPLQHPRQQGAERPGRGRRADEPQP
jgi:asparagine synthase (glutamine-hydrolysing)